MNPYFLLGIDGGGSKSTCWLAEKNTLAADNLSPIGVGTAGPSNATAIGVETATNHIDLAIAAAFDDAGISRSTASACVMGLAGAADENVRRNVTNWAKRNAIAAAVRVVPDYELPLAAAVGTGAGIALIAGTGSVCFGRNDQGQTARAGGWGYLLGDPGSGFAIGRDALRWIADRFDLEENVDSTMHHVLAELGAQSPQELRSVVYGCYQPQQRIAAQAPVVIELARLGCDWADSIVRDHARQLATVVHAVSARVGLSHLQASMAVSGGLLTKSPYYLSHVLAEIGKSGQPTKTAIVVEQPVLGAVTMAAATPIQSPTADFQSRAL